MFQVKIVKGAKVIRVEKVKELKNAYAKYGDIVKAIKMTQRANKAGDTLKVTLERKPRFKFDLDTQIAVAII